MEHLDTLHFPHDVERREFDFVVDGDATGLDGSRHDASFSRQRETVVVHEV